MQKKSVNYVSRQLPLQGLDSDSEYHSQESTQSEKLGQIPTKEKQGKVNQTIGLAGEDLVRYLLHRWHYDIFEPCNPSSRCDFVVNTRESWVTIQVKATEYKDSVSLRREKGGRKGQKKREQYRYTEKDFDFLFIVKFPKIYVIPFTSLESSNRCIGEKSQSISFKYYEDYAYDLNDPETYNNPPQL